MLKKMIAGTLVTVSLTMAATVLAADTVAAGISKSVDDFEEGNLGTIDMTQSGELYKGLYKSSEASGLFVAPKESPWSKHVAVSPGEGYNGTTGLKMFSGVTKKNESSYRHTYVTARNVALTDTNAAILRYKVKFISLPSQRGSLEPVHLTQLVKDGASNYHRHAAFKVEPDGKVGYYDPDVGGSVWEGSVNTGEWYTVVTQLSGGSTNGSDVDVKAYIFDENNNVIASKNEKVRLYDDMTLVPVYVSEIPTSSTEYTSLVIDDVLLAEYPAGEYSPSITATTVNEAGVARNGEISFEFDLPIAGGKLALKKGNELIAEATSLNGLGNKVTLNYTGMLDRKTEYTVSFSDLKDFNGASLSFDDVSFTTEDLHIWNDIIISSAEANGQKTDITFTLSDKYDYPEVSAGIIAALYRGDKMIGMDMVMLENKNTTSPVTESFSLGYLPQSGDRLQLMMMDTERKLVPLADGVLIIE